MRSDSPEPARRGDLWERLIRLVSHGTPRGDLVGAVGERVQLDLAADEIREVNDGATLHRFHDAKGNSFVWLNEGEASGMDEGGVYRVNATVLEHRVVRNVRENHIHRVGPATPGPLIQAESIPELLPAIRSAEIHTVRPTKSGVPYLVIGTIVLIVGLVVFLQSWGVLDTTQSPEVVSTSTPPPRLTPVPVPKPGAAVASSPAPSPAALPAASPVPGLLYVTGGGTAGVSFRSAPSASAQRLAILRDGSALEDRSEERQAEGRVWKRVAQPGGGDGWVAGELLSTSPLVLPAGSPVPSIATVAPSATVIPTSVTTAPPTPEPQVSVAPANKPGAVRVAPQGVDCPSSHPIKALASTGFYLTPGAASYAATTPEACLATASDAEAAGFKLGAP